MMDLWTLFVENVFGGFWLAVFGLAFVILIILALGNCSSFTVLTYVTIFLMAMAIGYGHPIVTIPIVIAVLMWSIMQWYGWLERGAV